MAYPSHTGGPAIVYFCVTCQLRNILYGDFHILTDTFLFSSEYISILMEGSEVVSYAQLIRAIGYVMKCPYHPPYRLLEISLNTLAMAPPFPCP